MSLNILRRTHFSKRTYYITCSWDMVKIYLRVTYSPLFLPFYTETDEAFAGLMSICLVTKDKVLLRYTPERDSGIAKRYR